MTLHRLRRAASRWLPRLLAVWLLALTAGAVNACVTLRTTAAGPAPTIAQAQHDHDHMHAQQRCDSALGHATTSPVKPAATPKDPRPSPALLTLLLPLPPLDPAIPNVTTHTDTSTPPPDPDPRYLTTARLRL